MGADITDNSGWFPKEKTCRVSVIDSLHHIEETDPNRIRFGTV